MTIGKFHRAMSFLIIWCVFNYYLKLRISLTLFILGCMITPVYLKLNKENINIKKILILDIQFDTLWWARVIPAVDFKQLA